MTGLLEAVLALGVAAAWDAWRRHVASRERREERAAELEQERSQLQKTRSHFLQEQIGELAKRFAEAEKRVADLDKTVAEKSSKLDTWRAEIKRDIQRSTAPVSLTGSTRSRR